ncbi:hypothetical protein DY000_02026217 [Brassica cretica]|uniref:PGG domain-containing protein n=1 Tax=Brassica cretica TaxID=69181 RepID=A0ABQ7E0A3_BRACR|nr:hypothetical protein DY000_02026217 [Brassica cretica]
MIAVPEPRGSLKKKTVEAEAWVKVMSIVVDVNRVSDVTQDENVYERLKKVAQDGDIERLYGLIAEDPDILGHFDKLNVSGYSPMHLALQVNHVRMVRGFIAMDSSLVSIKGRGRSTPLHHVARIGDAELLFACPSSVEDLTIKCETALHIACPSSLRTQWL